LEQKESARNEKKERKKERKKEEAIFLIIRRPRKCEQKNER
jgi:hypothetical protein